MGYAGSILCRGATHLFPGVIPFNTGAYLSITCGLSSLLWTDMLTSQQEITALINADICVVNIHPATF
jgi:hypothetical protein